MGRLWLELMLVVHDPIPPMLLGALGHLLMDQKVSGLV